MLGSRFLRYSWGTAAALVRGSNSSITSHAHVAMGQLRTFSDKVWGALECCSVYRHRSPPTWT